jgi:PAS domain S-box-containing protein
MNTQGSHQSLAFARSEFVASSPESVLSAPTSSTQDSLSRLLECLPVVVFRLDRQLRYLYVNGAVLETIGWTPERVLGRTGRDCGWDEATWSGFESVCREVIENAEPRRYEFALGGPSGKRHLESELFPEFDAHGALEGVVGIVVDASERKRAQEELRASEERYRTLIGQVKDHAIFAVDLDGHATTWNEGVERVLGWGREEFIGLSLESFFPAEDIASGAPRRELQRAAEEASTTHDRWLRRKDGTPFFASGMTSRMIDASGHIVGFSQVLRDRTAWKLAQDERDLLLASERKARQEAEQANRLKDEFLATLSHELRSPLNAIVGWVHVLRRQVEVQSEVARGLEIIERNARAQTQIINDLLDMSRIMTGKVELNTRSVNLTKVIGATLEVIRPMADAKGIRIETALDSSVPRIQGDPNRLQQVLWNLLINAVKFTSAGGRVHVTLSRVDSQAEISVQDSGVGIHPSFLPYVFDRFRQADASTTRMYGGLGLGLSIVKNLVELHAGSASAKSAGEGLGATFTISLPIAPIPTEPDSAFDQTIPSLHPLAVLPKLTGITALVVDDEVDSLVFSGRLLEERGARVLLAVDAQQALDALRSTTVDILISDIGMANEDGYYLIAQLRALEHERTSHIPAIAVTAYARAEDRQRLLLAGYQMHISKPIEPQELIAGIASLVQVTTHKEPDRG